MPRLSTGVMAAVVCDVAPSIYTGKWLTSAPDRL